MSGVCVRLFAFGSASALTPPIINPPLPNTDNDAHLPRRRFAEAATGGWVAEGLKCVIEYARVV